MRNEGTQLVGNAAIGMMALAGSFISATQNAHVQAKADRQMKMEAYLDALEQAQRAGLQRSHIDALELARAALEHINVLEAENEILRRAVASRDRILRSRTDV